MRRTALLVALLAASALPAHAQHLDPPRPSRLTITPYAGVRAPYTAGAVRVEFTDGTFTELRSERGGNPVVGGEAKVWLRGPLSLVAGGSYSRTGNTDYFVADTTFGINHPDFTHVSTDAMWLAKVAVSARFEPARRLADTRRRPSSDLFAGIALVREFDANNPALNVGFQGALPLGEHVEVVAGLEDFFVFWNDNAAVQQAREILVSAYGAGEVARVRPFYDTANILQIRLGFALRP